jgi:hypothetical protein
MSVPTGSDASAATEASTENQSDESVVETARQWASHWQAWAIAAVSLGVVGWSVSQPQASPKGYIPIFLGFAALAVGFVYLDEESGLRLTSS